MDHNPVGVNAALTKIVAVDDQDAVVVHSRPAKEKSLAG